MSPLTMYACGVLFVISCLLIRGPGWWVYWGILCVRWPPTANTLTPLSAHLLRCHEPLATDTKVMSSSYSFFWMAPLSWSSWLWCDIHSSRWAMVKASLLIILVIPTKSFLIWSSSWARCNSSLRNETSSSCALAATRQSGKGNCSPYACSSDEPCFWENLLVCGGPAITTKGLQVCIRQKESHINNTHNT